MKLLKIFFIFTFCFSLLTVPSFAKLNITVNGNTVTGDVSPFIKNGTTYVPIRFVGDALKVDSITWNNSSRTVTIKDENDKIVLVIDQSYCYVNNQYTKLGNPALISSNRTFVPVRFISEQLGATVLWKENTETVAITTKKNSTLNTESALYNDNVYWLSRIIESEASGEPFKGKVAVGEVILNRVKSEDFPNTIWGVIFEKCNGVYQFEPVQNGTIYNTPSEESIEAAKTALNGSNYVDDCMFFFNPVIAKSNWIAKNKTYYTTIANHDFYC